jgi:hypothetical protein
LFSDTFRLLPLICDFEGTLCNFKQFLADTAFPDDGDWRWQGGVSVSRKDQLQTGPLFDATYNLTLFDGIDLYNYQDLLLCEVLLSQNISVAEVLASNCTDLPEGKLP